jgi:peptide deformylase
MTIPEFLGQIQAAHQGCLEFLDSLDEAQLDIQGRHASGEMLTIEGFLMRIAQHRLDHINDVKKVLDR